MNKRGINKYEQMGLAATLPGMINAVEVLQGEIDRMRAVLGYAQGRGAAPDENEGQELSGQKAYWAKMTPEQRAAEMARRGMMGRAKRAAKKGAAAKKNGAASDEVDIEPAPPARPAFAAARRLHQETAQGAKGLLGDREARPRR